MSEVIAAVLIGWAIATVCFWSGYAAATRVDTMKLKLRKLSEIRPGAIFKTENRGVMAVKSEYHYLGGQCECTLLASGESAHFREGNDTMVREVVPRVFGVRFIADVLTWYRQRDKEAHDD